MSAFFASPERLLRPLPLRPDDQSPVAQRARPWRRDLARGQHLVNGLAERQGRCRTVRDSRYVPDQGNYIAVVRLKNEGPTFTRQGPLVRIQQRPRCERGTTSRPSPPHRVRAAHDADCACGQRMVGWGPVLSQATPAPRRVTPKLRGPPAHNGSARVLAQMGKPQRSLPMRGRSRHGSMPEGRGAVMVAAETGATTARNEQSASKEATSLIFKQLHLLSCCSAGVGHRHGPKRPIWTTLLYPIYRTLCDSQTKRWFFRTTSRQSEGDERPQADSGHGPWRSA